MTIKTFIVAAFLTAAVASQAYVADITTESAGTLSQMASKPSQITKLTLHGPVDASDLYFIGQNMSGLTELDLRDVTIESFRGNVVNGRTAYDAAAIPTGAFTGLPIEKVVLPVQKDLLIGATAFMNTKLTELNIPANVDSIGDGAFAGCNSLTTLVMPSCKLGISVFADCAALKTVDMGTVTVIPASTFRLCTALTEVKNSAQVVSIGNAAFEGDISLQKFDFGPTLKHLGASSFAGTGLTELTMDEDTPLKEVGAQAFADASLSSIVLPASVATIGEGAFFGNSELKELTLPSALISLGDHSLVGTRLGRLDLPGNVESLGAYSLANQAGIKEVVLPPTMIYIGDNAMEGMTSLSRIDVLALTSAPELGNTVWEGIDQSKVKLTLLDTYSPEFSAADQWRDFSFDVLSGVNDIESDLADQPKVSGRFIGTELQIESKGAQINIVRVFDTSGRLLIMTEPRDTKVAVETGDYNGGIFVVNVVLDNNTSATLKLGRR